MELQQKTKAPMNKVEELEVELDNFYTMNPFETPGVIFDEYIGRRGRRNEKESALREDGKVIRDRLSSIMSKKGMKRKTTIKPTTCDQFNWPVAADVHN